MIAIDYLKLSPNLKLKTPENKVKTLKSKVVVKGNIKSKRKVANYIDKIINEFYKNISHVHKGVEDAKTKILSLFKTHGKGAIIEVEDNPIFPLKLTLEYLIDKYRSHRFNVKRINVENSSALESNCYRKAFKEAQNSNQLSNLSNMDAQQNINDSKLDSGRASKSQEYLVVAEGKIISNNNIAKEYKHEFRIKNDKIIKYKIFN